ncbi:hypothetical protein RS9916_30842 [Synechococcus sp. RS9916]|nr:hypothetical protein RS9916_30842 [Synechococcus sp. RS9916]
MIRMRIGVMAMVVAVVMGMAMVMTMRVVVGGTVMVSAPERNGDAIRLTSTGALALAQVTTIRQALHMVMVAFLRKPNLILKAEHLGSVLTEGAIHGRFTAQHLFNALDKGVEYQGVIAEIGGRHEIHIGMIGSHQIRVLADATHQHT